MRIERRQWWRAASIGSYRFPTKGLVVAVIVLVVLLVIATITEGASVRDLPAPASASAPLAVGNGQYIFFPQSSHVTIGVHYRFTLFTHCGLEWPVAVDFDGSFWRPIGPGPASDGNGNPPPGFANPVDHGIMTLLSPTLAEYRTSSGTAMRFSRRTGEQRAAMCS